MKIMLEPRMVTPKHADQLRLRFPAVTFTQDPADAEGVDAVFCHPAFAVPAQLSRYVGLRWVQFLTAGFDTADIGHLRDRGLVVTNMKDIFHIPIAEDVFAKLLVLNRDVRHDLEAMKDGRWEPVGHLPEIHGSTVGILGAGSIGTTIATRLQAFGAHVIGHRRKSAPASGFDEIVTGPEGFAVLLAKSDYVIDCLPLNGDTRKFVGAAAFARMKPTAVFVNVGRGETVDQDALVEALREGRLRGAALDVTTPEPLPPEHPLWRMPNVFITPHNASSSPFIWPRITVVLHENIRRRLVGETLVNLVDE